MIIRPRRSDTAGNRPAADLTREGEIYINRADHQFGVMDASGNPVDLLAIRPFTPNAAYKPGDLVVYNGNIYKAIRSISAGQSATFNQVHWRSLIDSATASPGSLPSVSAGNAGQALVVDSSGAAKWGSSINSPLQEIYGGDFPGGTNGATIRIRSRLGSGAAIGKPTVLKHGELAYNEAGATAVDKNSGGALFIGNGTRVLTLVSSERQVETTGNQLIHGVKRFYTGIALGDQALGYDFPVRRGQPGQRLQLNAAGNTLEWAPSTNLNIQRKVLTGTAGSLEDNLNADPTGLTVNQGELWIIFDQESDVTTIWSGGIGTFGSAAGFTPVTAQMFSKVGTLRQAASSADVQTGVSDVLMLTPQTAASDLFRTKPASGQQNVMVPVTIFREEIAGDGNGLVEFHNDVIFGTAGKGIKITAQGNSRLAGLTDADPLTMENVVLDAGTF